MAKYRFDQVARECRTTFKGDKNGMPIVGLEHLVPNEMLVRDFEVDTENTFTKSFKQGQILFGRRRAYQQKAGVAQFDGICSGDITVIEAIPGKIEPNLLPFIVQNEQFFEHAVQGSAGSLSPRVKWEHLASYEIELPTMEKQRVLADKLWTAYRLKESYKKLLAATDEMVKSQFIEMFGKGNWEQKCLGEIGTFKRGGGFQKSDYVEHGIPCIHYGQIHTKFGPFIYSHITEISTDLEPKTKFASKGDLIIAITSEDTEGSCKSTAWLGDYPVAVGGHAAIFHHYMNPLYMSFFFKSTLFNYAKMEYIHGTKVFEVKPDDIAKILVPCPPMSLQKQFSVIARQADKSKFVGFKSQFIEMFGSVDDNPKSYDIKKVGDFAECFAGATPSTKISSYWDNGNIPWMSSGEVHKARVQDTDAKITQQGYDGCSTKMVPIHSIVIALAGQGKTRGTVAINDIELCTNQSLCAIVPNEEVNYEYLFHNLRGRYKELRSMSGDVDGRGGLNLKHIQSIKVIVPPMSEQMKFVSIARQADKSKLLHRTSIKYSKYSL